MQQATSRWSAYGMEAAGLFGFVLVAGLISIFFEHPELPGKQGFIGTQPLLRHFLLGIGIGLYTFAAVRLISKRSGAHMNPAVTLAFWMLNKMRGRDVIGYIAAQFAGAAAASFLLKATLYEWFSHPDIHFGATEPQPPHGCSAAVVAELIISFLLMAAILVTASSKRLEKAGPLIIALLLCAFLTFELPYSGMSMNPARSFSGDAAAGAWEHLWIYFAAPVGAMLLAAYLYHFWLGYKMRKPALAADHKELPCYPSVIKTLDGKA